MLSLLIREFTRKAKGAISRSTSRILEIPLLFIASLGSAQDVKFFGCVLSLLMKRLVYYVYVSRSIMFLFRLTSRGDTCVILAPRSRCREFG